VESEFGDWECGETTCLTSSGVNKASVPIETSECTCPEDVGFFEVESLCSCSVEFGQLYGDCTCPIGYSTESTTAECVACENGEFPNRFAYHEFGGGFDEGPGIATLDYITPCVCPSGNYLNGYCVTNKPDECPFGYFFSQDITDGLLMAGVGVCVPCPQGFIMNQDDGGVCSCFTDLGWTLNGNACVCDSEACGCPYGMIYSADQRRCVVPQCRDSYYGQFFTETLEIGLSGEELTENSMYFCACSAYAKRAYESNSGWLDICDESCRNDVSHYMSSLPRPTSIEQCDCIETIGYIYQDDLGTCLPGDETKCMIGWGYNPAESTQCNACDLGFAYDTSTSEGCYCPQISNLNQCFWPSDLECPDHYAYDVYSNQCRACPTGHIYSPSRKKCVCYTAGGWQIAKSLDRTSEDNFQQIMGADICWCPTDDCSCDVPGDVPGVYVYSEETGTCVIAEDYVLVCDENEIIGEYGSIASGELTTYKGCFCRHDGFNFLDTVTGKWSCRRDTCHADLLDGTISPAYSTELADNCICASEFTYGIPVSEGFEEGGERSIQDGLTVSCHCETTAYLSSHYPEACSCPIGYATDYDNHICIPCSDGTIPNMRRPSNTLTPQLLQTNSACVCPSQEYDANGRCITYFEAECPFGYYFDTENLDPSYQGNGGICFPCPQGFIYNKDEGRCTCYTDLGWQIEQETICYCPDNMCTCPYGMSYNPSWKRCVVPTCNNQHLGKYRTEVLVVTDVDTSTDETRYICACPHNAYPNALQDEGGEVSYFQSCSDCDTTDYVSVLQNQNRLSETCTCPTSLGFHEYFGSCIAGSPPQEEFEVALPEYFQCPIGWGYAEGQCQACTGGQTPKSYSNLITNDDYYPQLQDYYFESACECAYQNDCYGQCAYPSDVSCPDQLAMNLYTKECAPCPTGYIYSPSRGKCVCNEYGGWERFISGESETCVCSNDRFSLCGCDVPGDPVGDLEYNFEIGTCQPVVGTCLRDNEFWDTTYEDVGEPIISHSTCYCEPGYLQIPREDGGSVCIESTCSTGLFDTHWNKDTVNHTENPMEILSCNCPEGFIDTGSFCECQREKGTCVCPSGYVYNFMSKTCVRCLNGFKPNLETGECSCDIEGESGGYCQTFNEQQCPRGMRKRQKAISGEFGTELASYCEVCPNNFVPFPNEFIGVGSIKDGYGYGYGSPSDFDNIYQDIVPEVLYTEGQYPGAISATGELNSIPFVTGPINTDIQYVEFPSCGLTTCPGFDSIYGGGDSISVGGEDSIYGGGDSIYIGLRAYSQPISCFCNTDAVSGWALSDDHTVCYCPDENMPCSCPSGYYFDSNLRQCIPHQCFSGAGYHDLASWMDGSSIEKNRYLACACNMPAGTPWTNDYAYDEYTCVSCASNGYMHPVASYVSSIEDPYYGQSGPVLEDYIECPVVSQQCTCPSDEFQIYPQSEGGCYSYGLYDSEECVCTNPPCQCPPNHILIRSQNNEYWICSACTDGTVVDIENQVCVVPMGQDCVNPNVYYSDITEQCQPCPNGFQYDPNSDICVCPTYDGWELSDDGSVCRCIYQDASCTCSVQDNFVYNVFTGFCDWKEQNSQVTSSPTSSPTPEPIFVSLLSGHEDDLITHPDEEIELLAIDDSSTCECPFGADGLSFVENDYVVGIYHEIRYCKTLNPTSAPSASPTASPSCTVPNIERAKLDDTVRMIIVTFSLGTNQPGNTCGEIISMETLRTLGEDPTCAWTSQSTLSITLGTSATILIGDIILFNDNKITNSNGCGAILGGMQELEEPDNPPQVTSKISAQSVFGSCNLITFDASGSVGNAYRDMMYSWAVVSVSPINNEEAASILYTTVEGETSGILSLQNEIITAVNEDGEGGTISLTVMVTASNWVEQSSSISSEVTVLTIADIPPVVLDGDISRTAKSSDVVEIVTSLVPFDADSTCEERVIYYNWTSPTGHADLILTPGASSVAFPPFTFSQGQSYSFFVRSWYELSDGIGISETVTISILAQPPVVNMDRCDRAVTINEAGPLLLIDGELSYDADAPEEGIENLEFFWSCERVNPDGTTSGCNLDEYLQTANEKLVVNQEDLVLTNNTEVPVENTLDLMQDETIYRITLTVVHSITGASASDSCSVWTREALIPELWVQSETLSDTVDLEANGTNLALISEDENVELLNDATLDLVNYYWDCRTVEGDVCEGIDLDDSETVLTNRSSRVLKLRQDKFTPDVEYRFFVTATDDDGNDVARAFGSLIFDQPPTGGICEAIPSSGVAYETVFLLDCTGWTGGNNLYSFATPTTLLRTATPRNQHATTLSLDQTEIIATITNEFNMAATATMYVNLTVSDPNVTTLLRQGEIACNVGDLTTTTTKIDQILTELEEESDTVFAELLPTLVDIVICVKLAAPVTTTNCAMKAALFSSVLTPAADRGLYVSSEQALKIATCFQVLVTDIEGNTADYSDPFGLESLCALSTILGVSEDSGNPDIGYAIHDVFRRMGRALGDEMVAGQSPVTISCRGVYITTNKVDADPQAPIANIITLEHDGNVKDSATVGEIFLADIVTSALPVISSSPNFWPKNTKADGKTRLVNVDIYDYTTGYLANPTEIQQNVTLHLEISEAPSGIPGCYNYEYSYSYLGGYTAGWNSEQCAYISMEDTYLCECNTVLSVQGADVIVSEKNEDPFQFYILLSIILVVLTIYAIMSYTSFRDSDRIVCDRKDQVNDFLLQWYYYMPIQLRIEKPVRMREASETLKNLRNTRAPIPVNKVAVALWDRTAEESSDKKTSESPEVMGRVSRIESVHSAADPAIIDSLDQIETPPSEHDIEDSELLRIENVMKENIISRVKDYIRATGSEAACLLRESQRREGRFLRRAERYLKSARLHQVEIDRIHAARWALAEQTTWQANEWIERRKKQSLIRILWWDLTHSNHEWASVYKHRELDPYRSQWRANTLLLSMLLICFWCALFLGALGNTVEMAFPAALLSAIIVTLLTIPLTYASRQFSYFKWEKRLILMRDRLCVNFKPPMDEIRSPRQESKGNIVRQAGDAHMSRQRIPTLEKYMMNAWIIFIASALTVIGSIFAVGYLFNVSTAYIAAVILAEIVRVLVISNIATYVQAKVLLSAKVDKKVKDKLMINDNLRPIKAFHIFVPVMQGFRLNERSTKQLRYLVRNLREKALSKLRDVQMLYTTKGSIMLSFSRMGTIVQSRQKSFVSKDMTYHSVQTIRSEGTKKSGRDDKDNNKHRGKYQNIEVEKGNGVIYEGKDQDSDNDAEDPPIPPIVTKWRDFRFENGNPKRLKMSKMLEDLLEGEFVVFNAGGRVELKNLLVPKPLEPLIKKKRKIRSRRVPTKVVTPKPKPPPVERKVVTFSEPSVDVVRRPSINTIGTQATNATSRTTFSNLSLSTISNFFFNFGEQES